MQRTTVTILANQLALLGVVAILSACSSYNAHHSEVAIYVFETPTGSWPLAPALDAVRVMAPSWLGTSDMQYRLRDGDPWRLRTYAESRWAAPPAELLEQALARRILPLNAGVANPVGEHVGGCSLEVRVDEFEQAFDSPRASRLVLAVRAELHSQRGQSLVRRALLVEREAPSPDARGGVAAASAAVQVLSDELASWLIQLGRQFPELAQRCQDH